jgi:hypothetical protein
MGSGVDVSSILGITGGAARAAGGYKTASAQKASLAYQASVAANNAIIDQDKATIAEQNGQIAVGNQELHTAQLKGLQTANMAANGIDLSTGSAKDVLQSTDMMGQRDADQIQTNALREAWGYTTQAAADTSNAKALSSMADSVSPTAAMFTSMLGTATQVSPSITALFSAKNGNKKLGE